jgi:hypothetical protein
MKKEQLEKLIDGKQFVNEVSRYYDISLFLPEKGATVASVLHSATK